MLSARTGNKDPDNAMLQPAEDAGTTGALDPHHVAGLAVRRKDTEASSLIKSWCSTTLRDTVKLHGWKSASRAMEPTSTEVEMRTYEMTSCKRAKGSHAAGMSCVLIRCIALIMSGVSFTDGAQRSHCRITVLGSNGTVQPHSFHHLKLSNCGH